MTGSDPGTWRTRLAPWLLASAAFALAWLSPVEDVESDPGIALLATQSLLDHGTLHLDAYLDDPACAYDLETDYRIRRRGDSLAYYSHGVSLVSVPAVWLANRFGVHMLDQADELALQNLLSAMCCALLGALLYLLCRIWLDPAPSLVIAAVTLFGSSLSSTLATALWNTGYALVFLSLGLLHLARRETAGGRASLPWLTLLAGLAVLCRPTAAFAVLAAMLVLAPAGVAPEARQRGKLRRWRVGLPLALGLALLFAALVALDLAGWIPHYYSPLKLTPQTPLATGLYGTLLSPSRGLLVFSPFLLLVIVAVLVQLRALAGERLFRLAAIWSGLHLLAIATKGVWWGGHSYGPRLLAEVMLPAALVTCLAWRGLADRWRPRPRLAIAALYLACGLASVFIHSYQGLFNEHTRRWNWTPDVDRRPHLLFDWRYPQFLASERSVAERAFELERRELGIYQLGDEIAAGDGGEAVLRDWYPPEPGWRWSRGTSPEILVRLGELPAGRELYLLRFRAAPLGRQQVGFEVNGTRVGSMELAGPQVRERLFAFEGDLLRPGSENSLRFDLPGATATATDPRVLGLALHSFTLEPVAGFPGVGTGDEPFFIEGWSVAEGAWRWSDGHRAVIDVPVAAAGAGSLALTASALEPQPVAIRLNGTPVGELHFDGGFDAVVTREVALDPGLLLPYRMNRFELDLPRARGTGDDARLLGIAFRRLELLSD